MRTKCHSNNPLPGNNPAGNSRVEFVTESRLAFVNQYYPITNDSAFPWNSAVSICSLNLHVSRAARTIACGAAA